MSTEITAALPEVKQSQARLILCGKFLLHRKVDSLALDHTHFDREWQISPEINPNFTKIFCRTTNFEWSYPNLGRDWANFGQSQPSLGRDWPLYRKIRPFSQNFTPFLILTQIRFLFSLSKHLTTTLTINKTTTNHHSNHPQSQLSQLHLFLFPFSLSHSNLSSSHFLYYPQLLPWLETKGLDLQGSALRVKMVGQKATLLVVPEGLQ